jgi:nucleotide-binding universal stress UspA family protein
MYKTIYVPVDNSDHSNMAVDLGVRLAKTFGSKIVGSHVYAAKMHDKRFKQMEAGLPEEYHDEKELDRQRQIHDSLITRGLQIITDSYLDYVDQKCSEANLPLERRSLEGRNWKVLAEDINTNAYDLVIMGALGVGAVKDSVIGSNTERVARRVRSSDLFIVKHTQPYNGGKIVVAVDGSAYSFGGLMTGLALGKALGKPVEAISAFDPYFHYAAFHSISGVLNEEAGKVFRFKEQEKLHEEIIDSGLAKIYQSHLDISREIAQAENTDIKTALLDGKAFEKIIQYVRKENPWVLIVGRIGVHSDDDMDIGSNTENLLRTAPCHVLISNRKYVPPIDTQAEYTIAWTEEALARMEKIPVFARGVAKTAIHRYAIEKGHTIISNSVVDSAVGHILPKGAMDAMRALGGSLEAAGIDRNKMKADDAVAQDLMGSTLSGMMTRIVEEKPKPAGTTAAYLERMSQTAAAISARATRR